MQFHLHNTQQVSAGAIVLMCLSFVVRIRPQGGAQGAELHSLTNYYAFICAQFYPYPYRGKTRNLSHMRPPFGHIHNQTSIVWDSHIHSRFTEIRRIYADTLFRWIRYEEFDLTSQNNG